MRALFKGERNGSPGVVLGLMAVILLAATMAAVSIGSIVVAQNANDRAKQSAQVAAKAVAAEHELRATIVGRCKQRTVYDQRFVRDTQNDLDADKASLANALEALKLPIYQDPALRAAAMKQIAIVRKTISQKQVIVDQGVIGNCDQYLTAAPSSSPSPAA